MNQFLNDSNTFQDQYLIPLLFLNLDHLRIDFNLIDISKTILIVLDIVSCKMNFLTKQMMLANFSRLITYR